MADPNSPLTKKAELQHELSNQFTIAISYLTLLEGMLPHPPPSAMMLEVPGYLSSSLSALRRIQELTAELLACVPSEDTDKERLK